MRACLQPFGIFRNTSLGTELLALSSLHILGVFTAWHLTDKPIAVLADTGLAILEVGEAFGRAEGLWPPAKVGGACDGLLAFRAVDLFVWDLQMGRKCNYEIC